MILYWMWNKTLLVSKHLKGSRRHVCKTLWVRASNPLFIRPKAHKFIWADQTCIKEDAAKGLIFFARYLWLFVKQLSELCLSQNLDFNLNWWIFLQNFEGSIWSTWCNVKLWNLCSAHKSPLSSSKGTKNQIKNKTYKNTMIEDIKLSKCKAQKSKHPR